MLLMQYVKKDYETLSLLRFSKKHNGERASSSGPGMKI